MLDAIRQQAFTWIDIDQYFSNNIALVIGSDNILLYNQHQAII